MGALYGSHYLWVIFAFQLVAAVLLLISRFVPLAVAVLAPVIVNILFFHFLMGAERPSDGFLRGCTVAVDLRRCAAAFAGLFQPRLQPRI
jgi:hypothetical protein